MLMKSALKAFVCGVALLLFAVSVTAQQPPLPTANEIAATVGDEAQAGLAFRSVLAHLFQGRGGKEVFLSDQIRPEWLPKLDRVQFVLTTEANAAQVSECNLYWQVMKIERLSNVVTMRFDQHCGGVVRDYKPTLNGPDVSVAEAGVGSGILGRPEGCPCLPK